MSVTIWLCFMWIREVTSAPHIQLIGHENIYSNEVRQHI